MSELDPFSENILRVVIAQIFKTVGWDTMSSVCLNVLTDVLHRHIKETCDMLRDFSDHLGVAEPSISEVILLFRTLGINFENVSEYMDIADTPVLEPAIPKYPIPKPPVLNLLKPGSREMVTRPVHIHEHLPPMYPELEDASDSESVNTMPGTSSGSSSSRTGAATDDRDNVAKINRANMMRYEVGRPTRQLTCVTMTSSGFLSSSCEGKLADLRLPPEYLEREDSPEIVIEPKSKGKTSRRPSNESLKFNEKRKNEEKNSFEIVEHVKKSHSSKESHTKTKTHKHRHHTVTSESESMEPKPSKIKSAEHVSGSHKDKSHHKKKKKHNREMTEANVDDTTFDGEKLATEPNRPKLDIFKKISIFKDDRHVSRHKIEQDTSSDSQLNSFKKSPVEIVTAGPSRKRPSETIPQLPEVPKKKRGRKKKIKPEEVVQIPEIVEEETISEYIEIEPEVEIPHDSPEVPKFSRFPLLPDFRHSGPGLIPNINVSSIIPPMPAYGGMRRNSDDDQKQGISGLQYPFHTPVRTKEKDRRSTTDEDETAMDSTIVDEKKLRKEHKKMKKDKKEKEKKKKDKKHKNKDKDKEEKRKEKLLKKLKNKEKSKLKKEMRRLEEQSETSVPKLKLTLGVPSPQLSPSSQQPKIVIKPVIDYSDENEMQYERNEQFSLKREYDASPEKPVKRHKHKSKTHVDSATATLGMVEPLTFPQPKTKANPLIFDTTKPKRGPGRPRKNENKQRPPNKRKVAFYYDSQGNQVWICPICGAQDDGSPMVGCDGCDAWFHWVCVGMTAAPESKKWFCPLCLG